MIAGFIVAKPGAIIQATSQSLRGKQERLAIASSALSRCEQTKGTLKFVKFCVPLEIDNFRSLKIAVGKIRILG